MIFNLNYESINELIYKSKPQAMAVVKGSSTYPNILGNVYFYNSPMGVVVVANVNNLPKTKTNIHGFHIHTGNSCVGTPSEPFYNTGDHYNPANQPHPNHAGDLPPLFSNNGYAWMAVLTSRFKLEDIINRTVVIHLNPDDFVTQPSGNSGTKIACGVIKKV